ncbi:hypothetical protein FQN49_007531 [Arthroderma sp. PD_2]|nr:hypothetical protein FQN49_007531 [Arthroderma sp. PD_2]
MMAAATRFRPANALFRQSTIRPTCLSPSRPSFFSMMTPSVSEGTDAGQVTDELNPLLQAGWALDETRCGIEKVYYFKTYTKCQKTGSVHVHWTTHHPRGLSLKDTLMARYCDEQSSSIGTVEQSEGKKCHPGPSK